MVCRALGLSGDTATRQIRVLSGGEKARVSLAAFVLQPASVLFLDEVRGSQRIKLYWKAHVFTV